MWRIFLLSILFILSFSANIFSAKKDINVYSSNMWLSKQIFFSGEKIRIYTRFKNDNNFDTIQTVGFFDNDKLIINKKVEIAKKQNIIVWTDYVFTGGKHKIVSKITKSIKTEIEQEEILKPSNIENLKLIEIDTDTDGDKIGDKVDTDDDNDGFSDEIELEKGSDPKSKLSTPNIETVKNKITDLLSLLNKKRQDLGLSIEKKLELREKKEKQILINSEKLKLINQFKNNQEVKKSVLNKKNLYKNKNTIKEIDKKTSEEIAKIKKKKISEKKKDIQKSTIYQLEKNRLEEIINKDQGVLKNILFWILTILKYIFQSIFLTILFIIFLIWLSWKIIHKIFDF